MRSCHSANTATISLSLRDKSRSPIEAPVALFCLRLSVIQDPPCLFVTSEKRSKPFVDKGFFCLPSVDIYETHANKPVFRASYSESCFC